MSVIHNNLYNLVIYRNAKRFNKLRIISGYSSSSFLKRVVKDFPELEIELYIGMMLEGISIENHQQYQNIVNNNERVNVYYQVVGIPNHMKLYEFINTYDEKKIFIGSANFSENGFMNQKEILGEVNSNVDELFSKQSSNSLLCTDKNIEEYITIIQDNDNNYIYKNKIKDRIDYKNKPKLMSRVDFLRRFRSIKNSYLDEFDFRIVQPKDVDVNWNQTGINSRGMYSNPVLKQTNTSIEFQDLFPVNNEFKIYTDDSFVFTAKLGGNFNREIHFLDINIYQYFKNRINLKENRPISFDDLKNHDSSRAYFTRLNENEYFVEFKNKSYD